MKLVSMKKDGGHGHGCACCATAPSGCSEPDYPWGTRLNLEEDQVHALGFKAMPAVGAQVQIQGIATVISAGAEQRDGKTFRRLELQITEMGVKSAATSRFAGIYDEMEGMED